MSRLFSKITSNTKLLFTRSSSLNRRELNKKRKVRNRSIGYSLVIFQTIIAIIFLFLLINLNVIPNKYIFMIIAVLLLITAYDIASQFTKAHIFGKCLAFILSIVLCIGSIYIDRTSNMLSSITNNTQTSYFSIIVLNSDAAESLGAVKGYPFAYNALIDSDNSQKVIAKLNTELNTTLTSTTYNDWTTLVNGLYNQNIKAIILNEDYRSDIESKFSDFNDKTKIIETIKFETKINLAKNVITEPFSIYIGGNDTLGDLNSSSLKNDVNIVATFNPNTRQVLLVTTPRDYYIKVYSLSEKGTKLDKLTHAGNFGVDASIVTLNNLYGIDIDYYARITFSGTISLVDALGGITIYSEKAFTTTKETSTTPYSYVAGENQCNGIRTLQFCRERLAFDDGDNQRGRNQMLAIQGIIAKASSPAILKNYSSVMDSVSGMFETSMPQETITALIKDMLNDSTPWNVQTYNVTGIEGDYYKPSLLYPEDPLLKEMSVQLPDYDSVYTAIQLISKINNGEIFNVKSFIDSQKESTSSKK